MIKWSRGIKLWSKFSVTINTTGILQMGPIVLLKLTTIGLILVIIWSIILILGAEILSITLFVDLLWVLCCEDVYWALF